MISKRLFEKGFQAWIHKVDRILFETFDNLHGDYDANWRAMYKCGYLAVTAVYEATGV